jgi:hypothetical protein
MQLMARRRYKTTDGGIGALWALQLQTAKLGMAWLEMTMGAAQVMATRSAMMGAAVARPAGMADPEMALMVTEKMAAIGEAAERLSLDAIRRAGTGTGLPDATGAAAAAVAAASTALTPFQRRVRANVRRLKRKSG